MPRHAVPHLFLGLTDLATGVVLRLATTHLAAILGRRRKRIEHQVVAAPLWELAPNARCGVHIIVRETTKSQDRAAKWRSVPIRTAYVFEVSFHNVGSETVLPLTVEIYLDQSATIVAWGTRPKSRPGYEVIQLGNDSEPNVVRVVAPFINRGDLFIVGVLSVGNRSTVCRVRVLGPGVQTGTLPPLRLRPPAAAAA